MLPRRRRSILLEGEGGGRGDISRAESLTKYGNACSCSDGVNGGSSYRGDGRLGAKTRGAQGPNMQIIQLAQGVSAGDGAVSHEVQLKACSGPVRAVSDGSIPTIAATEY